MVAPVLHVLENDAWRVGLLPGTGAAIAFAQVRRGHAWVDLLRPTPEGRYGRVEDCASYVLAPWSNRVRDAVFRFRGTEYRLVPNFVDGTAIHGIARDYPWRVASADANRLLLTFDSRTVDRPSFPFPFSCELEFRLEGSAFSTATCLRNEGDKPFCAGFGHHPYFQRSLSGAAGDAVQVEIPCQRYYLAEQCLPSAAAIAVEPRVDFRTRRPLGTAFVDDCLTDRPSGVPIRLSYPESGVHVELSMDDIYSHVVVYVPRGETFFAIEPVTNVNDGFNLQERGVAGTGVFVLEAASEKRGAFTLRVAGK